MALWTVRVGKEGEHEEKFLSKKRIYLTWDDLSENLSDIHDDEKRLALLTSRYPDKNRHALGNWRGQIWSFVEKMKIGDLVAVPIRKRSTIHIGKITGDYCHSPKFENPYYHYRTVEWLATDVPRLNFDQELLSSFSALGTISQSQVKDAEERVRTVIKNLWKPSSLDREKVAEDAPEEDARDIETLAGDEIAKFIIRKYKGHGMARLIGAILESQGYSTRISPKGPDQGVDILAAPGPLGFGSPKLCVQVKSGDSQVEHSILQQLGGAVQDFQADHGLLVSWGGFKSSVIKEEAKQYFNVRLWGQKEIIDELLRNYDALDEEIKAEIPLKRIWTLATTEDE